MITLPGQTLDPNLQALSRQYRELRTGSTSTTWVLKNKPMVNAGGLSISPLFVFKNGLLLRPTTDYTVTGQTVTLASAPVVGDTLDVIYWFLAS